MTNYGEHLDQIFRALTDPTRRAVLVRLSLGPAPMKELAGPFGMALPSFSQHLDVLEKSGLVSSVKKGRVRTYTLEAKQLKTAESWLAKRRELWEHRLDNLDKHLKTMKEQKP